MIVSGKITKAGAPSSPQGQHNILYQDIEIQGGDGQFIDGRIGSKSGYAKDMDIEVTVEQKNGQNGPYNYFKKYNPQYPDRSAPSSTPAKPSQSSRDFDKENHGKCFSLLLAARIPAVQALEEIGDSELAQLARLATACMNSYDYRPDPENPDTPF